MSQRLRLPNIRGESTAQKLEQLKSYLYQTVSQLNWLLESLQAPGTQTEQDINALFSRMRPLIMASGEIAQSMGSKLAGRFAAAENLPKGFKVMFLQANQAGLVEVPTRFNAFQENGTAAQMFFICGSLGGSPLMEVLQLYQDGTVTEGTVFAPYTRQGQLVLQASAGDCFLIFTYLED